MWLTVSKRMPRTNSLFPPPLGLAINFPLVEAISLPLGCHWTAINLPLVKAISLQLVEATCTGCLPATFQKVIFQASFVYTMYCHIILYLQLFTTVTGWQENMVETQSPQL